MSLPLLITTWALRRVFHLLRNVGLIEYHSISHYISSKFSRQQKVPGFVINIAIKNRGFNFEQYGERKCVNLESKINLESAKNLKTATQISESKFLDSNINLNIISPLPFNLNFNRIQILKDFSAIVSHSGIKIIELTIDEYLNSKVDVSNDKQNIIVIDSEYNDFELSAIFSKFKENKSATDRIIMLVYDLWRKRDLRVIEHSFDEIDFYLHMDAIAVSKYFGNKAEKFLFWPITHFSHQLSVEMNQEIAREPEIFFSGRIMNDRLHVINTVLSVLPSTRFRGNFHFSDASQMPLDNYLFQKNLLKAELSLSLTQRAVNHWIIPGRSLEILLGGSLLVQQEGESCRPLSELLVPYENYLPFTNSGELEEIILYCSKHPEVVRSIARKGNEQVQRLIQESTKNVYHQLLNF
jgi:hypothetical protein